MCAHCLHIGIHSHHLLHYYLIVSYNSTMQRNQLNTMIERGPIYSPGRRLLSQRCDSFIVSYLVICEAVWNVPRHLEELHFWVRWMSMYRIFNPPGLTYWKPQTTTHTETYCGTGVKNGEVLRGIRKNLGYVELYYQIVPNIYRAFSDISLRYPLRNQNRISRPHSPTPSRELSTEIDDLELVLEGVEAEVEMSEEFCKCGPS